MKCVENKEFTVIPFLKYLKLYKFVDLIPLFELSITEDICMASKSSRKY